MSEEGFYSSNEGADDLDDVYSSDAEFGSENDSGRHTLAPVASFAIG